MATDPKSDDELKRIYRELAGVNPTFGQNLMDEETQRVFISKTLAQLMQRTHPMVMMTMMVVALGYMADEHGVNREHLITVLREARQTMTLAATVKAGG